MPWGAAAAAAATVAGSVISSNASRSAAQTSANAQLEAARLSAEAQKFRPVGITTGFGTSRFGMGPEGYLESAGYELTPELQAIRNRLLSSSGAYNFDIGGQLAPLTSAAQGLFGLGGQLLPTSVSRTASPEALALQQRYQQAAAGLAPTDLSMAASPEAMALSQQLRGLSQQVTPTSYDPTAAAQQYFQQQQALLEPSRQAQLAQTRGRLFGTGRGGLGVTTATGGASTSPELQAYYNAIAQQDAALAARSTDVARQRLAEDIALGTQLGGTALTTQQRAEDIARQRTLGNLQASLGYGGQAIATGLAGEDVARQRFAQDLALGTGLFGTGGQLLEQVPQLQTAYLGPLQTQIGLAAEIERLGQTPLDIGAQLGGRSATAGANVGQSLLTGGLGAARTLQAANQYSVPGALLTGFGQQLSGTAQQQSLGNLFTNLRYGSENVYGGAGRGTVPTSITADTWSWGE